MQHAQQVNAITGVSLDGILAVLEMLAEDGPGLTVAGIAERLGITRGETVTLIGALERRGMVERDDLGGYSLALVAVGRTQHLINHVSIIVHARPFLEELAKKHGEAVCLSVLRNDEVVVLDVAEISRQERVATLVGKGFPSLTTTAGKAIRALQSRDLLEKLFRGRKRGLKSTDLEKLFEELDGIRSKGVAVDVGSLEEGMCSVATAVRDYAGKVVCALTVLGPSFRMVKERIEEEIVPSLVAGGELLAMKFGCVKGSRS